MRKQFTIGIMIFFTSCSGCSFFENDNKPAELEVSVNKELLLDFSFELKVIDRNQMKRFTNEDFDPNNDRGLPYTIYVETSTFGVLNVIFELLAPNTNQVLSKGNFQYKLQEDYRYAASFISDSIGIDPTKSCIGCFDYYSFEVDQSKIDDTSPLNDRSIYVITSGNSISEPVIY